MMDDGRYHKRRNFKSISMRTQRPRQRCGGGGDSWEHGRINDYQLLNNNSAPWGQNCLVGRVIVSNLKFRVK